jgi:copper chaperone NosL
MKKITKILIIASSLAMITAFFTPIWMIDLEAPQYPEGLGMQIWINKITGDLNTINGLNHYIGMKKIEPDSIKELSVMPYVLAGLIALGVVTGITGKKKLMAVFVILFVAAGVAGGVDFYMWEYDYGHNLSDDAAIKVPGMSYQPPLFGSKQLLNFVANSYPDTGGWVVIGAGLLSLLLFVYELRSGKKLKPESPRTVNDINGSEQLNTPKELEHKYEMV